MTTICEKSTLPTAVFLIQTPQIKGGWDPDTA